MTEELTVTQFNERVNSLVTYTESLRNIALVGEITGLTRSSAGHVYFNLKDKDSVVRCTLFRFSASRVTFPLKEGLKVTAYGSASYYVKGGSFGFNIEAMSLFGKGDLQKQLEELTAKLLAEGLFDAERKRDVPRYPKVIGVVTSPTGAVIRDIIDTTARRYPVDILLAPATVQGEDAPKSIVSGIVALNEQNVDVIIVGRGGGSKEDLIAFNDESVVRAVACSRVPVISAVGHATDKSLTDRAADKYAETPTAAAMLATPDRADEMRNVNNLLVRAKGSVEKILLDMRSRFTNVDTLLSPKRAEVQLNSMRNRFDRATGTMDSYLKDMMNSSSLRLERLSNRMDPKVMMDRVNQIMMELDDVSDRMDRSVVQAIESRNNLLIRTEGKLDGLDPMKVLGRGYSMLRDGGGNVLTSVSSLHEGEDVTITMRDGDAVARIKEVRR